MMVKKIHYCWFGGNPLPDTAVKCIASWKKFLPDYEIVEWNESNYNVHKIPYIDEAYQARKYAFVSDYARFDILSQEGGVYFDTDVEVIKDLSPVLEKGSFVGLENPSAIATGLGMACEPNDPIVLEILASYQPEHFMMEDGSYNYKTVVTRVTEIFQKHGFDSSQEGIQQVGAFGVYPKEYFSPKNVDTGILTLTDKTYTIHHYDASWVEDWQKKVQLQKFHTYAKWGDNLFSKLLSSTYYVGMIFKNLGLKQGWVYIKGKF